MSLSVELREPLQDEQRAAVELLERQRQITRVIRDYGTRTDVTSSGFANGLLYKLECVWNTTLGPEVIDASIPCSTKVLAVAMWTRNGGIVVRYLFPLLAGLMLCFYGAKSLYHNVFKTHLEVPSIVPGSILAISAFLGVLHLLLTIFFFVLLYIPLHTTIGPLSLVFFDGAVLGNEFLEVSAAEPLPPSINLESHKLASLLPQHTAVRVMVYGGDWEDKHISGGLRDLRLEGAYSLYFVAAGILTIFVESQGLALLSAWSIVVALVLLMRVLFCFLWCCFWLPPFTSLREWHLNRVASRLERSHFSQ